MEIGVWLSGLITAVLLFQVVAIPGLILRRNDFADILWGPAFPITAFVALFAGTSFGIFNSGNRTMIVLFALVVWGARLFTHVGWRNLLKKQEDVRYANWRKQWGAPALLRSWAQVFVLQALILYVFLLPVLLVIDSSPSAATPLTWIGFVIWIFGFVVESGADEQLRRFKSRSENKGKIMTQGLWSWSRHPNYFGEVTQWWGIWLMACDLPYGFLTVISPIGVTYLILKVSGVSMLEDLMKSRPGYAEYAQRTSAFFLRPPRKK